MFRTTTLLVCLSACGFAGRQVISLEDHSPRDLSSIKPGLVNADGTITNVAKAGELLVEAMKGTPSASLDVNNKTFAAIIHVVAWKAQTGSAVPQAQASHWYVYSGAKGWDQDAFATNNRIFGIRHIVLLYVYLNLPAGLSQFPRYDIEVTSKLPAPLQHLFQLSSLFVAGAATNDKFGVAAFDVPYLPSDMSITPNLVSLTPSGTETVTKTGDSQAFDNEGDYWWDVSVGIPIHKMSDVTFDNTNNTVSPQTVDKRTMFALLDLYPWKKDVKSTAFDWRPYGVAGVAVASQPLHRILVGIGWGPQFAQFYAGALFTKQQSLNGLQAGSTATPAQQGADTNMKFGVQFAFGINIPVGKAVTALSSGSQTKSTAAKTPTASAPTPAPAAGNGQQ